MIAAQANCVSCQTLRGEILPPGGILFEDACWCMFLAAHPMLVPGQGFIVLKRHCENVADLTHQEQETLGVLMAWTAQAMNQVLQPEKVHFGLYGEGVKHIHLHVTPRVSTLPAGNIPMLWLSLWHEVQEKLRLRQPIPATDIEAVALRLKAAFAEIH